MLKSSDLDFVFRYNACLPPAQHCVWDPELSLYNGYIRVDMNLARPINVISGSRPPSTYNIVSETRFVTSFALPLCLLSPTQCALDNSTINDRTLTTFYLPPGTERALHITSQTTTQVDLYTHWARSLAELLVDNVP